MEFAFASLLMLYVTPFAVAVRRQHPRYRAILALNLGLGWTGLGWWLALVWAWPPARPRRWRDEPPRLYVVAPVAEPIATPPPPRAVRGDVFRPTVAAPAALGLVAALALAPALPRVPWWPEVQAPTAATPAEVVVAGPTVLRSGPSTRHRELATLAAGCAVSVTDHRGGWKRIWRVGECAARDGSPSEGWIPAARAGAR